MGSTPRVENRTAAALAVSVDELGDRNLQAGLAQRIDHEVPFPGAIMRHIPVLDRAAPAHAEMRADRRNSLRTWRFDVQQLPAVVMARPVLDVHNLPGQGGRYIDWAAQSR